MIATLMLMILLMLLAVGMLSLSTVSLRSSGTDSAANRARANARMALMIAIGELQKEMGPDMRISAEAAIHDTNPATEKIDGIAQPHWLAAYDSWGNFLNGEYTPEGKSTAEVSTIADTYVAKRAPMFRRWLVSLPDNLKNDVNAADTALSEEETVLMVGEGTLGKDLVTTHPNKVTRAYKIQTEGDGAFAWWVSPENHKAKIGLAAQKRDLNSDQWAVAQGVSSEVGVGGITGLGNLDTSKADAAEMANRIISFKTLELSGAEEETARSLFFDLTEVSSGMLTNSRSGGLKKDLSLLFENNNVTIPQQYKQASNFAPEPSIRPLSKDVLANNAVLPRRPFASWPNMRHYYRMYRRDTDTLLPTAGLTDSTRQRNRNLNYTGGIPITGVHTPNDIRDDTTGARWAGQNSYHRAPVLARFLLIHSYATQRFIEPSNGNNHIAFLYTDTPVVTLWNPYSTALSLRSGVFGVQCGTPMVWPNKLRMYRPNGTEASSWDGSRLQGNVAIKSRDGADIVFAPGEFKVFSFKPGALHKRREAGSLDPNDFGLFEGFEPNSNLGGMTEGSALPYRRADRDTAGVLDNRNMEVQFYRPEDFGGNFVFNCFEGNAPGSLTLRMGPAGGDWRDGAIPQHHQIDWFQNSQRFQSITKDELGGLIPLIESPDLLPVGYSMLTLKTVNRIGVPASWDEDWRSRNWLYAPPYGFGGGLYMSENAKTAHTQRLDSAYEVSFGPTSPSELIKLTGEINGKPWLGFGSNPYEKVTAVPALELPTAPISSLASFSGMRTNPGWIWSKDLNPEWAVRSVYAFTFSGPVSLYNAYAKIYGYQSGITGGGIGNSFIHPMIPREKVYFYHDNSKSQEHANMTMLKSEGPAADAALLAMKPVETKAYCDYWDHVLMLNDALWDDYFISSIADQTRPWASAADNLDANLASLTSGDGLPISRYQYHSGGLKDSEVKARLKAQDGYLKAAEHLIVDGAFNVNSTSVNAWYALFKGIRERKLLYRNSSGSLNEVAVPEGHIAISRLDTPNSDKETTDLSQGAVRADGHMEWSGIRFLDDSQIRLLAEKCVEQVKRRGPFLNFSEFINRRLENSELGLMGALQSAIDYDDANPDSKSINYRYKSPGNLRIDPSDLGNHEYQSPDAVRGSRLAGIPGYVIQSDILKPIANTLQVRDDTFRIRAYGEALDAKGKVIARVWCEAIVQRAPEYYDEANDPSEPAYLYQGNPTNNTYDPGWDGAFTKNNNLTPANSRFGRKFKIASFRWLNSNEI